MATKYKVLITPSAEKDIQEIWDYIAQDFPERANAFITELERQVLTLETFPLRCPLIPENNLLHSKYRHLIYQDYRTIFRIANKNIYVLRVMHGSRLLEF